ncbi:MAG TPA: SsrA-binding protein SmpB [Anaerolineae bacterium]|nr:SsrA-binding protein SmpB [Anaerolineae bacterium]
MPSRSGNRTIAQNRKARHEYIVEEIYEAGIALTGTEIKSIREGRVSIRESFATIRDGEVWLLNMHIAPYEHGNRQNHDPRRPRKLLLHRREINRIAGRITEKGWTLVPLKLYLKDNLAKIELGLARGKRRYDKRQAVAKRDYDREMRRAVKDYVLGQ